MQRTNLRLLSSLVVLIVGASCRSAAAPLTAPSPAVGTASTVVSGAAQPEVSATTAPTATPDTFGPTSGIGDPYFPQLGNLGYDALHYTLDLSVAMQDRNRTPISATVTLQARATQDLSVFSLDFRGFPITALTVDGQPSAYQQNGRKLQIQPTQPLRADDLFTTTITYSGIPVGDGPSYETRRGWNHFAGGIYTFGVPDGASTWYPVNDHPRDKASYTIRITVPRPYVATANGRLVDVTDQGMSTTYQWESQDPIASYLVGLVIAHQQEVTQPGTERVTLRNYVPTTVPPERTAVFNRTPEMLRFLEELFGPYPFDTYGVVVVDTEFASFDAMEHQTLSMFANTPASLNEAMVVHELAHQWFGNSVSLTAWNEGWLKEGFATYAEWLWEAHNAGTSAENVLRERVRTEYTTPEEPWEHYPPVMTPEHDFLLNPSVYTRGALTLHALRVRVGDETFWQIVRSYAERYRHGNASTQDFIALAEEISGQDLEAFFDAWLRQRPIPPITELGFNANEGS